MPLVPLQATGWSCSQYCFCCTVTGDRVVLFSILSVARRAFRERPAQVHQVNIHEKALWYRIDIYTVFLSYQTHFSSGFSHVIVGTSSKLIFLFAQFYLGNYSVIAMLKSLLNVLYHHSVAQIACLVLASNVKLKNKDCKVSPLRSTNCLFGAGIKCEVEE